MRAALSAASIPKNSWRLNPNRRVPVIDDDGTVVWESHAIVRYLAAKYGAEPFWPADPGQRAQSDMWTDWTLADLSRLSSAACSGISIARRKRNGTGR